MKVATISDNHMHEPDIEEADVLLHAGDATWKGTRQELLLLNDWFGKIKHKFKYGIIFSPGNHDMMFEEDLEEALEIMTNCKVVIDETVEIEGVKIYCSPWQPWFHNWAFNLFRGKEIKEMWDKIPVDTDILVTHGPPKGILDMNEEGFECGCFDLFEAVERIKPRYHIFGHIHEGHGIINGPTTFINASVVNRRYKLVNKPFYFNIEAKK